MKIPELKNQLKKINNANLEYIFIQAYKKLKNDKKEEIDQLILSNNPKDVVIKKPEEITPLDDLLNEIEGFITDAYEGAFVRRKKNSKLKRTWRSYVKNCIIRLLEVNNNDPLFYEAKSMVLDLINLMFYASGHYVFSYTESGISGLNISLLDTYNTVADQLIYDSINKDYSFELLEEKTRNIYNIAKTSYSLIDYSCFDKKLKEAKEVLNK